MKPWPTSLWLRSTTRSCCSSRLGQPADLGLVGALLDLEVGGVDLGQQLAFGYLLAGEAGDARHAPGDFGAHGRVDHVLDRADHFLVDFQDARLHHGGGDQHARAGLAPLARLLAGRWPSPAKK